MLIADAEASLRADLANAGLRLDGGDAEALIAAMIDWYVRERADDAAPLDEDGDMLLFQWGPYDPGDGPVFEYGLTRQLIRTDDDEDEDEGIIQLAVTARYAATDATTGLGRGHRWCSSPAAVPAFRAEILGHPASDVARSGTAAGVSLTCEVAG